MLKTLFFISALLFASLPSASAQSKKSKRTNYEEGLITALATSRNMPPVVGDDGVFVNTLLEDAMPREVTRILKLGKRSVPLLISHLDDMRLTEMDYCCSNLGRMTIADACLDILARTVRETKPMFDTQCVKGT